MKARGLMRVALRRIELRDVEIGDPPDDGIVVRNEYTAISVGTELHSWKHGPLPGKDMTFPGTTGYCNAGRVVAVGKDVDDVEPGDLVAGQSPHAGHAIVRPPHYCRMPEGVSTRNAAFMVMAAISLHGVRVARIELGESVAVLGVGLVGQFAVCLSKLAGGVPVVAIDRDRFRLDKARASGADACLCPDDVEDLPEAVRELCVEDGVNVAIEATGVPAVYPMVVKLPCANGRVVALGSPRGTVEMNFLAEVHLREVSILGAIQPRTPDAGNMYYVWTKARERGLVLRLMAQGRVPVEHLITHVHKPAECQDVYSALAGEPKETLGVLLDWREEA